MKNPFRLSLVSLVLLAALISSCEEDSENTQPPVDYNSDGVYIINEGSFMGGNASVSYYNIKTGTMSNDIFQSANGFPLGDVAQSMTIHNGKGYIIVNNSQKIEVVNLNGFTSVATIGGLSGPRYMVIANNKGYVTEWFSDEVKVIDLSTNGVIKGIPAGTGPEQLCVHNNKIYVTNIGGFTSDSTVTVIDAASDSAIATIPVGLNPNSVAVDLNGTVWVLCGGSVGPDYVGGNADDTGGSIWKVNPASLTATEAYTFNDILHPVKLRTDGTGRFMYFLNGSSSYTGTIWKFDPVPANISPFGVVNRTFYGLGIDPGSGYLYGGEAPDFSQNGKVYRYKGDGTAIDTLQAGIAPGHFTFKE